MSRKGKKGRNESINGIDCRLENNFIARSKAYQTRRMNMKTMTTTMMKNIDDLLLMYRK